MSLNSKEARAALLAARSTGLVPTCEGWLELERNADGSDCDARAARIEAGRRYAALIGAHLFLWRTEPDFGARTGDSGGDDDAWAVAAAVRALRHSNRSAEKKKNRSSQ